MRAVDRRAEAMMRKFSVVTLHHSPITMNEKTSVTDACEQMRARRAGSVLVTGDAGRLVGKRISARIVGEVVASDERIGREQRLGADDLRIAGRDVEGLDVLVLILPRVLLIEGVRDVEPRSRELQI